MADTQINLKSFLEVDKIQTRIKNIAGVDIVLLVALDFKHQELDLFSTPLWVDGAIIALQEVIILQEEIVLLNQGVVLLRQELRVTSQRVNLFEKVMFSKKHIFLF